MKSLQVEYGKTPQILLLGNGINRAYGFASWDDLIEEVRSKDFSVYERICLDKVPYPLQPVILTDDHIDTQIKKIAGALSELKAPEEEELLLREMARLPVDAILTTNYTYELERALNPEFKCLPTKKCKWRHVSYEGDGKYCTKQLYTYYAVSEQIPSIWHIHGEASRPDTMIFGHYYYGKLLAKMQKNAADFVVRYNSSVEKKRDIQIHSWVEYFMMSDVYIVGCGMSLSEFDLWWLVNCKKRHFPDRKIVLYKPDINPQERLLADAYGVIVEDYKTDFKKYYEMVCGELNFL